MTERMSTTSNLDPDAQLMLRVQHGDREAFETLVNRYKQPVMNLVYRIVGDLREAEDISQNVFVQVYKSAARYRVSAKFSTWLYTITRNLCLNEIRRRTRHPAESLDTVPAGQEDQVPRQFEDSRTAGPPESLLQSELERNIQRALDDLPANQRVAILLCRQDDLSYEQIAQVLGCSLSATKSLIHRARETLREKLKRYLRTGDWTDEQ
jgi:RNA polymerase sigma-70 factor (ECF subfamily)